MKRRMADMPMLTVEGKQFECKLIIFNMDGTLIDERPRFLNLAKARATAIKELLGGEFVPEWSRLSGVDLIREKIDMNGPLARASRREDITVAATAIYLNGRKWFEARNLAEKIYNRADEMLAKKSTEALFTGVEATLKRLRNAGLKLAIATNESRFAAEEIMRKLGVGDLFDFFVGADDVENPKPSPDMILRACEKCGCPLSEAVMIGDQPADLLAGRNASVGAIIAVRSDVVSEDEVADLADAVIGSVAELNVL